VVTVVQTGSVPDILPSGATRLSPIGYDVSWAGGSFPGSFDQPWSGGSLRKPAAMSFTLSAPDLATAGQRGASAHLAAYDSIGASSWQPLGGTMENGEVTLPITQPGRYALFAETSVITSKPLVELVKGGSSGHPTLADLAFTPRVFSPTGAFASREVGISFTLGRPAPVTVRVYTCSGRLVREVTSNQSMNTGANLVRWDGRDWNGEVAVDGLYVVTVGALGRTERKTLAVVR